MRTLILGALAALGACAEAPSAAKPGAPPKLEGAYIVEDVDGGGVIDNAEVTVLFGADGKLSGRSACNRYGGSFTFEGGVLKTGPLISTKMACPPALMDLEFKFLNRLEGELVAEQQADGAVILSDDEGSLRIRPGGA